MSAAESPEPEVRTTAGVDPRRLPAVGRALQEEMRQNEDRWGSFAHTLSLWS